MRLAVFVFILVAWFGLHAFAAVRLGAGIRRRGLRVMLRGTILVAALLPLAMFVDRLTGLAVPAALRWVMYISMGFSVGLLSLVVIAEAAALASGRLRRRAATEVDPVEQPSRRLFLQQAKTLGVTGGAALMAGVGYHNARRVPEVKRVDVSLPGLAPEFDGYTIAQLSDVHIGPTIHGDWLDDVVAVTNALDADLVALTGDLVDGHVEVLRPETEGFGRLRSRDGIFFVTGNHEHYWDGEGWCRELERLGATVLRNSHRVIERGSAKLVIAGVPDYSGGGGPSDPAEAKRGAPEGAPSILLAHQPRSIFAAVEAGYDLQLSGHTHGGQFFPSNLIVHLVQPHVAGLERRGDTQIYVSRGTGYWGPPNRLGAPSEITLLTLRCA